MYRWKPQKPTKLHENDTTTLSQHPYILCHFATASVHKYDLCFFVVGWVLGSGGRVVHFDVHGE